MRRRPRRSEHVLRGAVAASLLAMAAASSVDGGLFSNMLIIGSIIGGAVVGALVVLGCVVYCTRDVHAAERRLILSSPAPTRGTVSSMAAHGGSASAAIPGGVGIHGARARAAAAAASSASPSGVAAARRSSVDVAQVAVATAGLAAVSTSPTHAHSHGIASDGSVIVLMPAHVPAGAAANFGAQTSAASPLAAGAGSASVGRATAYEPHTAGYAVAASPSAGAPIATGNGGYAMVTRPPGSVVAASTMTSTTVTASPSAGFGGAGGVGIGVGGAASAAPLGIHAQKRGGVPTGVPGVGYAPAVPPYAMAMGPRIAHMMAGGPQQSLPPSGSPLAAPTAVGGAGGGGYGYGR